MRTEQKRSVLLAFALMLLVPLACTSLTVDEWADRFECSIRGGIWHSEVEPRSGRAKWCEYPETPEPATGSTTGGAGCIAPSGAYAWSYEDLQSSSGTGGTACNARFIFRNTGNEPLYLITYTSWDNNAMRGSDWGTYQLTPGGEHEESVNRAIYNDGVVTFTRIDKILVLRDTPECAATLMDDGQAAWEAQATGINEIPCP